MATESSHAARNSAEVAARVGNEDQSAGPVKTRILDSILDASLPAPLPPNWAFFCRREDVRQLKLKPSEFEEHLKRDFKIEELCHARVLLGNHDQTRLHPIFSDETERLLVDFDAQKCPVNVTGVSGELASASPPFFRTLPWLNESKQFPTQGWALMLATGEDLQVAQSLGLAATTSAGLRTLSEQQMQLVFGEPSAPTSLGRKRLVIPAWRIAPLNHRPALATLRVISHLRRVSDIFGVNVEAIFSVWLPSENEFTRIVDAVRLHCPTQIVKEITVSINRSLQSPPDWGEIIHRGEMDHEYLSLADIRGKLERCTVAPGNLVANRELRECTQRYERALRRQVSDKFLAALEKEKDPVDASILFAGSEITEQLMQRHQLLRKANDGLAGQHTRISPEVLPIEDTRVLLQLASCLMRLRKS